MGSVGVRGQGAVWGIASNIQLQGKYKWPQYGITQVNLQNENASKIPSLIQSLKKCALINKNTSTQSGALEQIILLCVNSRLFLWRRVGLCSVEWREWPLMNVAPGINEKKQGTCHGEVSWHHGNDTAAPIFVCTYSDYMWGPVMSYKWFYEIALNAIVYASLFTFSMVFHYFPVYHASFQFDSRFHHQGVSLLT